MSNIANNNDSQNKGQKSLFLTDNISNAAGGEKCPVCGISVPADDEYCHECGVMLNPHLMNDLTGKISVTGDTYNSADIPNGARRCKYCGFLTPIDSEICIHCLNSDPLIIKNESAEQRPSFTEENTRFTEAPAEKNSAPAFGAPCTNRGAKMPKICSPEVSETPTAIAFDWIEITGKKRDEFLTKNGENDRFLFEVQNTKNDDIKEVFTCYRGKWEPMGKLWVGMRNGFVRPDWCKLKLENAMCYSPGKEIRTMIELFFDWAGIDFRHFSRVDVAADFQKCDYRGGLNPQLFMERVAKRRYVFKGKGVKTINKPGNSAPYAELDKDDVSQDDVEIYGRLGRVETIKVGSRHSGLSISMYNKSAEMRAKVDKSYIRENWKIAGMLENVDTYRVEFQVTKTPKGIFLFDEEGELQYDLTHASMDIFDNLETYYRCLWLHHFRVAIFEPGQRFSRMKKVELFNVDRRLYLIARYTEKQKNNNYVKAGLKAVVQDALKYQAQGYQMMASELFKYVEIKLNKHDLHKWFDKQFPGLSIDETIITYRDILTNKEAHRGALVQGNLILNDERVSSFAMGLS